MYLKEKLQLYDPLIFMGKYSRKIIGLYVMRHMLALNCKTPTSYLQKYLKMLDVASLKDGNFIVYHQHS